MARLIEQAALHRKFSNEELEVIWAFIKGMITRTEMGRLTNTNVNGAGAYVTSVHALRQMIQEGILWVDDESAFGEK
jgi:hypothetical protein